MGEKEGDPLKQKIYLTEYKSLTLSISLSDISNRQDVLNPIADGYVDNCPKVYFPNKISTINIFLGCMFAAENVTTVCADYVALGRIRKCQSFAIRIRSSFKKKE